MSKFFVESLQSLEAYTPGFQPKNSDIIKLNTNENPFPPSPEIEGILVDVSKTLHLYNDPTCQTLKEVFAKNYDISEDQVIFSNGSDEILAFAFQAFCDKNTQICFPEISYGFYEVFAELYRIPYEKIHLKDDLSIKVSDYFSKNKTILIANPNAPTGICLGLSDLELILNTNQEHVVIIDEAYIDFGGESAICLINKFDNLLVTGTFSKSRNLAGARLGYAVGNKDLIADLNRIKFSFNPYNVNAMTQAIGVASLENDAYFKECCNTVIESREYLLKELDKLGFTTLDSKANFVFTKHPFFHGKELLDGLLEKNILVRHFSKDKISDFVRITIGTRKNMEILVEILKELVEKKHA